MSTLFLTAPPGELPSVLRTLQTSDLPFTVGNIYYVNPVSGSDSNPGTTPAAALQSLAAGYALMTEGHNDVLVLIGNGLSTGAARLTAAFNWAKDACHLVGVCSGSLFSPRARIAPTTTATAFANFFTVSGSGCYFRNIEFWGGFTTGTTGEVCMTVSGGRNVFNNCQFSGLADAASAADTGSSSLALTGNIGENYFLGCTIGVDTVTRSVANSSMTIAGACPRNVFDGCIFPFYTSSASALGLSVGSGGLDRSVIFRNCLFLNAISSGSTTINALSALNASAGGYAIFKTCTLVGISGYGTTLTYIDGGAVAAHATVSETGLAVAPYA